MRVLVTGSSGFIGKNLLVRLAELPEFEAITLRHDSTDDELVAAIVSSDAIVHLAGINRTKDPAEFASGNCGFTRRVCEAVRHSGRKPSILLASSIQAELANHYGESKRLAEAAVEELAWETGVLATIYRLPNVFGKWCRPDYNSVVATFCHNIARGLPIRIDDPAAKVRLVYVDDVVTDFVAAVRTRPETVRRQTVSPEFATTVGELAEKITAFRSSRVSLLTDRVGTGLTRALYATFVSYLPPDEFSYSVPSHRDARGAFVEMLKTLDSGQFSFFSAHPGVTRGSHYHHSKTEKFLVVRGQARFRFRHILTDQTHELQVVAEVPTVVETIPGWTHDITNIGEDELLVVLWANEVFDRSRPDTIACKV